jgi:hypothetical protein
MENNTVAERRGYGTLFGSDNDKYEFFLMNLMEY